MNIPDWLWQSTEKNALEEIAAVMAIIHYTIKAAKWAVKKYSESRAKDVTISMQPATLRAEAQPLHVTVSDSLGITDSVMATLTKGTPSLADRLGKFLYWYVQVS
jgi:hypothetical protein